MNAILRGMNRDANLQKLDDRSTQWDIIIVGGGATGLSAALDAATRGYRTLLVEQEDFSKGTSSRSTKLIHGGVRYLKQGNVSLVRESLHERGRLLRNAPHSVKPMPFVVPGYHWWEPVYYTIGLKLYDMLAGKLGIDRSRLLSKGATMQRLPGISPDGLSGGTLYYDAQFDDARLALAFARSADDAGACILNYVKVTGLEKTDSGKICGVHSVDTLSGQDYVVKAKVVINATGVFTDGVRRMDDAKVLDVIEPSQGIHLVLDRDFLPGDSAIMIPKTDDGRVLFAIPWLNRVLLGTTDTPGVPVELNPRPQQDEIDYLIEHAGRYLVKAPSHDDIRAIFAGLRPLVRPPKQSGATSEISRDHSLFISDSGLVTIAGGKWTTCRKMAEDTIDQAYSIGGLEKQECVTHELRLNESPETDAMPQDSRQNLHERLPYTQANVLVAVRHEMAQTLDDVLSRRTRCSFLDEKATAEIAPEVAKIMAAELGRDEQWIEAQLAAPIG